ncbi:MAG: hypothetical protein WA254_02165, partial [Candidatus Sulfotelmatobacter sp.]
MRRKKRDPSARFACSVQAASRGSPRSLGKLGAGSSLREEGLFRMTNHPERRRGTLRAVDAGLTRAGGLG